MSNLTPEVRTDKNGNAVIRWIRSFTNKKPAAVFPTPVITVTASPKSETALTTPVASPKPSSEIEAMELCGLLQPTTHYDGNSRLGINANFIARRDPELLQKITHAVRGNAAESEYWEHKLGRSNIIQNGYTDEVEYNLSECHIATAINPLLHIIANIDPRIRMHSAEPHQYRITVSTLMKEGGITNPPEALAQAVTLISYIKGRHTDEAWIAESGGHVSYRKIAADAKYIAAHLDQVIGLLPELRSRKAHDRGTIEMLLNADVQVLRDGEL